MADEILNLPFDDSFVFALNGKWGEGKTSVLSLMEPVIRAEEKAILVSFNPWYFPSESQIIEGFYASIENALKERFILPGLGGLIGKYIHALSLGLEKTLLNIELKRPDSPDTIREKLELFIRRTGCKLVIFVDDLDRLDRDKAETVLTLTSLSGRLKNTIFLLAVDLRILRTLKIESEFLEKIVQRQVNISPAEQSDIDRFLLFSDEHAKSAIDSTLEMLLLGDDRRAALHREIDLIYRRDIWHLFPTLRHAKRFVNVFMASLPPIAREVNVSDFFLLTCLQVAAPSLYADL